MLNPGHYCQDLIACVASVTQDCHSVLSLGCCVGRDLTYTASQIRIGIDAHLPYLQQAEHDYPGPLYLHGALPGMLARFVDHSVDAVLALDIIEHLQTPEAKIILQEAIRIARVRIVVFAPEGDCPQNHDAFGLGGEYWQTHRSQWSKSDLMDMGFDVAVWEKHHTHTVNINNALFAIRDVGRECHA